MLRKSEVVSTKTKLIDAIERIADKRQKMFSENGVVVSELPNLQIEVNDEVILEMDDLLILRHLLPRVEKVTIREENGGKILMKNIEIYYESPLKLGDRVALITDDDTDENIVLDRVIDLEDYGHQKYMDGVM